MYTEPLSLVFTSLVPEDPPDLKAWGLRQNCEQMDDWEECLEAQVMGQ